MHYLEKQYRELCENFYICSKNVESKSEIVRTPNGGQMISANCLLDGVDQKGNPFKLDLLEKSNIAYVGKPGTAEAGVIYPDDQLLDAIGKVDPKNLPPP